MGLFVAKLTVFVSLVLALIIGLFAGTGYLARQSAPLALPDHVQAVVLGHSHAECAFMDSLVPGMVNLAQSGESYFYSHQKLKGLLDDNPQLERVFVEFTNNQIDAEMNAWIWSDKYLEYRFPMYAPYLSVADMQLLLVNNTSSFLLSGVSSIKENVIRRLDAGEPPTETFGGYLGLQKSLGTDTARFAAVDLEDAADAQSLSLANLAYLEKMQALCTSKGVRMILVRSPQHPDYAPSNETEYQRIRRERFAGLPFWDFGDLRFPDSLYADLEHLNLAGSRQFTVHFLERLEAADGLASR